MFGTLPWPVLTYKCDKRTTTNSFHEVKIIEVSNLYVFNEVNVWLAQLIRDRKLEPRVFHNVGLQKYIFEIVSKIGHMYRDWIF